MAATIKPPDTSETCVGVMSIGGAADSRSLDQILPLLRALAEPIRLRVVTALRGGERCVCDLTRELGLAQSKLSFHLKVLKDAGLIHSRQEGRWIYYRLEPSAPLTLRDWLDHLAADCHTPAPSCS
jgi:ArsR family transcriptional regulator